MKRVPLVTCLLILITFLSAIPSQEAKAASKLWEITINLATEVLSNIISDAFSGNDKKITQLESNIKKIERSRDYPSKSQFNELRNNLTHLKNVYYSLSQQIKVLREEQKKQGEEVASLKKEIEELKRCYSGNFHNMSEDLQRLRNYDLENDYDCWFTISDSLAFNQVVEYIDVFIEGRFKGRIIVNIYYRNSWIKIGVDSPGKYNYTLVAHGLFFDAYGNQIPGQITCSGSINVYCGSNLQIGKRPNWLYLAPDPF